MMNGEQRIPNYSITQAHFRNSRDHVLYEFRQDVYQGDHDTFTACLERIVTRCYYQFATERKKEKENIEYLQCYGWSVKINKLAYLQRYIYAHICAHIHGKKHI